MKISPFKTYSISNRSIPASKVETAVPEKAPLSLMDKRSLPQSEEQVQTFTLSSKLLSRINKNKDTLRKKRKPSKIQLKKELERLISTEETQEMEECPRVELTNKHWSSQDTWYLTNIEKNVLRYMANDRDPYYQIRNYQHVSLRK
jgi:hypothetical protein